MKKETIAKRFTEYLSQQVPEATRTEIISLKTIFGGASRQTFAVTLNISQNGSDISKNVILRQEFDSGIIDTDTKTEWDAYRAFFGTEVPVPEMLWLEEDSKWLGSPFLVMEQVMGCQSDIDLLLVPPYDAVREKIGMRFCEIMGTIAKTEPAAVGLDMKLEKPSAHDCWKKELDYWEADINKKQLEPYPVLRAAIRWLRRNPPPPAQDVVIVHGDMRVGNFLYNEAGDIKAVLDWEMIHLGDPLEDLAWALNPIWSEPAPGRMGVMLSREEAIEIWEKYSGFKADPKPLFWWEVFSSVKCMAIWISMANLYAGGKNTEVTTGFGGIWAMDLQRGILLHQLRGKNETFT